MLTSSNFSLRQKILVLVVGSLLLLSGSAGLVFHRVASDLEDKTSTTLLPYAINLADAIASQFFERYADVQAFSINQGLLSGDSLKIQAILDQYTRMYQIYDVIVMVDLEGNLIASNSIAPDGSSIENQKLKDTNFSTSPWFQSLKAGNFTNDTSKGFSGTFVEDVAIDSISSLVYGEKMYGNSFSTVVKDNSGEVIAFLSARAGFRWVEYEFTNFYQGLAKLGFSHAELTLINHKGEIIIDYDPLLSKTIDLMRDFEQVLLKLNLASLGVEAAQQLVAGHSGSMTSFHARKKINQIAGFTPIKSPKFMTDLLGWGVLIRVPQDDVLASLNRAQWFFYSIITITLVASIIGVFLFTKKLVNDLTGLANALQTGSSTVAVVSDEIAKSSHDLSESTSNQASSLQETVASISEISAMVRNNAINAQESKTLSESSEGEARRGKDAMDRLSKAIYEINESNENIEDQMEKSNQELTKIVEVISEISNKTQVINDIVFQTKLLSFNASVEAQRAGEHGKGFAIVADEVGNLAQMSGTASAEINELLGKSIDRVETIVRETSVTIKAMTLDARKKIEVGNGIANECQQVLDSLLSNVSNVNERTAQISVACNEQDTGISEVRDAMSRLDGVTHKNSNLADQASHSVVVLDRESSNVASVVVSLNKLVHGRRVQQNLKKAS